MKEAIKDHFRSDYRSFYKKYLINVRSLNGGEEHVATCPFHDDTNPSFNFNAKTGQYLCHGCGKKGDTFHFYAKLNGLDTRRNFNKVLNGIAKDFGIDAPQKRITKIYDYIDAEGNLLFQVCRFEPKGFGQRRPNGRGGWTWNLKGIDPVLYRLPEILKENLVILVEGEKDADNLAVLGFPVTTSPMGAGKWRSEYSECLKDKTVVLIPDNDKEGRLHTQKVGQALYEIAKELYWIELPNLPAKGDISDWLELYDDKKEATRILTQIISEAKPYEPPKQRTLEDAILEASEFRKINHSPKKPILNPWLTFHSINLISGWRGVGKTWFVLLLLDAVTRGEPLGPWEIGEPVPCLYLDGEMVASDIKERLMSLNPSFERKCPLYIYSDAHANSLGLPRANLLSETWRTTMKRILTTRGVKLWVADNLASLASGIDENLKKDWDPVNQWLLELRFAGISTILLHHAGKGGGQRGTSGREDNVDTSIILKHPFDYVPEDGARYIVNFVKARVSTNNLSLISDTQFQLREDKDGQPTWAWGNVKRETRLEVIRMIDEGSSQQEIAVALGITKGRVSQIKKTAINEDYLSSKGNLTQRGHLAVNEG